jgi:hypothetical protein
MVPLQSWEGRGADEEEECVVTKPSFAQREKCPDSLKSLTKPPIKRKMQKMPLYSVPL